MITEDYVSFETAKLLKEKGFKRDCIMSYIDGELISIYDDDYPSMYELDNTGSDIVDAPTLQMAMKWLRKIHGYVIVVELGLSGDKYVWTYKVIFYRTRTMLLQHEDNVGSSTYEETVETALKYCLNLI